MKSKQRVSDLLERASNLAYTLENAVRARKADYAYVLEQTVKIKEIITAVEQSVNLEHES